MNSFRGSFSDFTATLAGESLEGTAKVASVDVKDEQLNGHLQTPDFFDARALSRRSPSRPPSSHRLDGNRVEGKGELTIKGVTQPITLTGEIADAPATDPFGRERLGLRLESAVDRTAYGVSWNAPNQSGGDYLANDVKLIAELALVRQEG